MSHAGRQRPPSGPECEAPEFKNDGSMDRGDFKGLRALADAVGDRFHRGVLLYTGKEALPFGKQMHALPVGALWRIGQ